MIDADTLKKLRADCNGMCGRFFYDAERGDIAYIAAKCEAKGCDCEQHLNADGDQDCSYSLEDFWGEEHVCEPVARMLNATRPLLDEVDALRAENAKLMSLVGQAMDPPKPADMRADYLAAWLHLTNASVLVVVNGKPATLADRVKLLVASRNDARLDASAAASLHRTATQNAVDAKARAEHLAKQRNDLAEQLDQLQPILSVLGDYDWAGTKEDGTLPEGAEQKLIDAMAYVENARKAATETRRAELAAKEQTDA